ncbi:MAG: UDP-GlcNAc--UDP-phosphate GlcNAc-1-phosphate transferase [Cyclobacteriaceae bacterium]|nr:UDP-GlcNAc--UDP-phosphate GlcNAc-1-phosphate transferase [Cyclobacteriaceae bacterium]
MLPYLLLALILFGVARLFIRLAPAWGIVDTPNQRSSHRSTVIRGGGIVFLITTLLWFVYHGGKWPWMIIGGLLVGLISLWDDFQPRSARVRLMAQALAMALLFVQVDLTNWNLILVGLAFVICLGSINAFNFMDGINGITGVYALVNLGSFLFINETLFRFTDSTWILAMIVAVLVFLFFNFRKSALFFAGDVGSIMLAYTQVFLLLQLIHSTDNLWWVVFFWVFGMDATITIVNRLMNRENIFTPHRTHLYQFLANEFGYPHRLVAVIFGFTQLVINLLLLFVWQNSRIEWIMVPLILLLFGYLVLRRNALMKFKQNA